MCVRVRAYVCMLVCVHYLGVITLILFVTRLLVVLAFYVACLGFSPDLFFSISNRTFVHRTVCALPLCDYCDNVWSVCTKQDSHQLETLLNFACRTVLRNCRDNSASSARKELGISTLSARQKVHLHGSNCLGVAKGSPG